MAISNIKATFQYDIEKIWNIVTTFEDYSWRSDISRVEVLNDYEFIEYTKDGYATRFTVTAKQPWKRWEFDMENDNMKGHWTGVFEYKEGVTTIDFTEDVKAKKIAMKPFVGIYLKKQQSAFISDLEKALAD